MHPRTMMYAGLLVSAVSSSGLARVPDIRFEKYKLPNGLEVILHEDHATPLVAVNVWYHVASKDERPGRTGFAHLFEHMMFQGTKHYDDDYFKPLQEAGARLNGSTATDRTNYWENVPSAYLELALWMEADRMGFLLPAMTRQRLDNQRDVVKNERRQSYENRPYGLAEETILAALYPPEHPYSWPVIGSMADIGAASLEDVSDFFRHYYHPDNASLCIAGDFDPAQAKQWVAKYFGPLPAGPKVERLKPAVPTLTESKRIRMEDRVGLARVYLDWPTVAHFAPDDAELGILADVLGRGKTSRLYRRLVHQQQIAQDVMAYQDSGEIASRLSIIVTARPGVDLGQLEAAVDEEIARLHKEPPTAAEIARAVNGREAAVVKALEQIGGFGGRADRLNMYNVLAGDPGFLTKDIERYRAVNAQAVQRVAQKYLVPQRIILEVVPGRKQAITPDPRLPAAEARQALAKASTPARTPVPAPVADAFDRSVMPKPGTPGKFTLPTIHRRKLSIGSQVLVVEKHGLPSVYLRAVFPVGRSADPAGKLGLADLMGLTWDEGTQRRSALEIADQMAGLGAELSVWTDWDTTSVRLFALKHQLGAALEIYSDVLRHPAFQEAEVNRQRAMTLGRLVQMRNEPLVLANLVAREALYGPDHPYGRPQFGTPSTLKSLNQADLAAFYRAHIRPEQATFLAVGDITPEEAVQRLEQAVRGWRPVPEGLIETTVPAPPAPGPARLLLVDKPGAAQSVIALALIGTERKTPDYFPLVVMNSIFGGQFSSRLNMNLREEKGYTYGARSSFDWRVRQPGPFLAGASVQTAVTAPAVVECLKELRGMTGARPLEAKELEFSKTYLVRGFPADFETPGQWSQQLETLATYHLPDDYFRGVIAGLQSVTSQEVLGAARKYLTPEHLTVVVVGDRSAVEADLRKLPIGKDLVVYRFDQDFRLSPAK